MSKAAFLRAGNMHFKRWIRDESQLPPVFFNLSEFFFSPLLFPVIDFASHFTFISAYRNIQYTMYNICWYAACIVHIRPTGAEKSGWEGCAWSFFSNQKGDLMRSRTCEVARSVNKNSVLERNKFISNILFYDQVSKYNWTFSVVVINSLVGSGNCIWLNVI